MAPNTAPVNSTPPKPSFFESKAGLATLAGGGLGLLSFGLDMFKADAAYNQSVQEWKQQADAVFRSNQRQAMMIKDANTRTADIYGYQTGRFNQNLGFIQEEYSRAGEDLQRQLGEQFAQSAYNKQAQLSALSQAVGFNRAAFEGSSRSRERADVLGTLGTFGRNAAMEAERLAGTVSQSQRSRQALGRQATQSVFSAYGDIGVLPELQRYVGQETPMRPGIPNQGLQIASSLMGSVEKGLGSAIGLMGI